MDGSGLVDLGPAGAELAAVGARVEVVAPAAAIVQAAAVALISAVSRAATAGSPFEPGAPVSWLAERSDDGLVISGPDIDIIVEGSPLAPASMHLLVGERTLSLLAAATPVGSIVTAGPVSPTRFRARLVEGNTVLVDTSVLAESGAIDHLDGVAVVERAVSHAEQALRRSAEPGVAQDGLADPAGRAPGAAVGGVARAAAGAAAAAIVAKALKSSRPTDTTAEWRGTHAVPADGLDGRDEADPAAPVVTRIPAGAVVKLERRWGEWANVEEPGGWAGWVDARLLTPLASTNDGEVGGDG